MPKQELNFLSLMARITPNVVSKITAIATSWIMRLCKNKSKSFSIMFFPFPGTCAGAIFGKIKRPLRSGPDFHISPAFLKSALIHYLYPIGLLLEGILLVIDFVFNSAIVSNPRISKYAQRLINKLKQYIISRCRFSI